MAKKPIKLIQNIWTRPYCGMTYLGSLQDERRVAVQDHGGFAVLARYVRGGGFSSRDSQHPSVEAAQRAGERWIAEIDNEKTGEGRGTGSRLCPSRVPRGARLANRRA